MNDESIHITVHGGMASGKSRFLFHLMTTLIEQGFTVEYAPEQDYKSVEEFAAKVAKTTPVVVEHIKANKTIVLHEKHTQCLPTPAEKNQIDNG